ncbi:MAG TPA: tetratricopeptide repeat protein, partial [Longimicrobiales bacterium]|nr:tetratricopeptide repeat protein [Longimicrobiales bacterium]
AWPAAGLGAAWFLIGVLPVSNLLLPIGTVLAERTLYLPSVALALWVGFAAGWLGRLRIRRPVLGGALVGVAGLWLAGLAGRTVVRNPVWASNETLVAAGLESHPGSFQVQWFRALEVWDRGDTVSTGRIFREALAIYDGDARFFTHYARFRYAAGDLAGADSLAARALAIQPTYGDALFLAGQVAIASGDPVEARRRIGDLRAQGLEGLASALTDSLSVNAPPGG